MPVQTYGNEIWNKATSNEDKRIFSAQAADFTQIQDKLDNAGMNYCAYYSGDSVKIAVNNDDVDKIRQLLGVPNLDPIKSTVTYVPPEKNIIGNAEYRYIPNKEYISADRDLILKMAEMLDKQGIKFSGRIYPTGKGTLTVSRDDLAIVRSVRDNIIDKRRQVGIGEKGQLIGNRSVSSQNRHLYMSTLTPKQYEEVKPFIETNARYSGVIRDGKVMFSVDRDEAQAFHRALDTAKREVALIRTMQEQGLTMEQMTALSPVIHRIAADDTQINLADFFDKHYDEAQFGEMLSLVNAYLDQPISERYGEHSKLNDMLEAKSNFDRSIELSDFFSDHDFSGEQKNAISAMFVGDVTRGQIESIDETFTVQDIHDYDEILHTALQESDIEDFLTAHRQAINYFIRKDIPDIDDEMVKQLITAFDGAAMADWEKGDNQPKINRIKRALYDILGDEKQTEKAFACIAKYKYNVTFDKPDQKESSVHFGLLGNGITAYDVSRTDPETHDYPTVAHISPEGVVKIYDENISSEDLERIKAQAQSARNQFMSDWDKLSDVQKFQKLLDRADISTSVNINREKIPMEQIVDKYMPFVFFGEGERPEPEQQNSKFQIYQLPGGEKYHGIRFEGMEQLKKDGVQLNKDDYELVYESMVGDFRGNSTLEGIFTQFNTNQPADFTGHSLSVSDVIVISVNDKDTAYYCDSFGFTEMPEFFRDKELVEEKNENKATSEYVTLRKVGDFYEMYGKNAEIGAEVLGLHMLSKNGSPMVGFPDHVKDEYSAKLREAGYTVLIEQAFELNPPKREAEKLQTLQQVVDKFFGSDCESAETERGTWKLAVADGEKVGELYYGGEPVCGIYNRGDKMEIGPYRELTTFPALLRTAMLEHNPDKPVEIMDFQRTFETPLDKAKWLINDFCDGEYREGADFSDLHNVGLAFTTLTDDELPVQVTADLIDFKITYEFDGEVYNTEQYDSIEDMIDNGLTGLDFSDLVSVPDEVIERHIGNDEEIAAPESDIDDDTPLFSDESLINLEKSENSELFDDNVKGEQLSFFSEPVEQTKSEKPKSEFASGPIVDGVQVYQALAAEIDRGTDFENGKFRVQDFFEKNNPTTHQLADFLKKEYGTGGHSGEGNISLVDYNSQGMTFSFENGEKFRHSWNNVATMVKARLDTDTYLTAKEKAERQALAEEKGEEIPYRKDSISVGDKFRNKLTGVVSEVVSLTGALPFYTDDCTVKRMSGEVEITENIPFSELLNADRYEHIGEAETEKEHQIFDNEPKNADMSKQDKYVPIYKGDWEITDNKELYKEIVAENKRFAEMADKVIGNGLDPNDSVKALTEEFGFERTAWLTALNIAAHPLDGRFYQADKEWACNVLSPYFEIKPDEILSNDTEKRNIFERLINGGTLYNVHNTHLAQFAETLMPEYEKYLERSIGAEKSERTVRENFYTISDEDGQFFDEYPHIPTPEYSPWGSVQNSTEIANGVFQVSTAGHGGVMIREDLAEHILSPEALKIGFVEDGYHCYEEDANADIPLRELLDKGIMDKEQYFSEHYGKTVEEIGDRFEKAVNDSISAFHPEYWQAHENAADKPDTEINAPENSKNFTITDNSLGEGGAKAKFRANFDAIHTLKTLEAENRPATADEKETLSKYVGWGAIPQAFDKDNDKWSAEYSELKDLLDPQEYAQARASVNDAFYTSPTVIEGIYQALEQFGFDGGKVLEPAMGVGNFFGCMPEDMQKKSDLYGVEIDSISGRIAQKLYPDADIAIQGFEKNSFQNECFDVAVGNVPFGELGFKDEKHSTTKLHDYFFMEAMDKLKNGGIMAFVTSAGTLDKRDESVRQMLADKADLIGAIRLPGGKNGAFHDNAGTDVTTDIIFLQKHEGKSIAEMSDIPDWVHIGETADGLPINQYFADNPDMVLGKVVEGNKLYGSGTMVVAEDGFDLKTALHDAVSKLSAEISHEKGRNVYAKTADGVDVQIPSDLRNFSFFMQDDAIYFKKNAVSFEQRFDKKNAQFGRYKAFIELRDITRELIQAQELNKPDSVIADLQAKLGKSYDDFYNKYGLIHSKTNKRYFIEDISYNLVAGLEKKIDKDKLVEKSDIFTKRTICPPKAVECVETAMEALTLSVAEKAKVDFDYMSKLTGMSEDELKQELVGEIFKIPHTENTYQTASEYLSGDIRAKLREAEEIAEYDSDFNINVNALQKAMPEPLKAGDIDVKIGATWLDPKYYDQFMYELLGTPDNNRADKPQSRWFKHSLIQAEYSEHSNSWHIANKKADRSVLVNQKYGSGKMNAYEIMEHLLNLKEPKVYKTIEVPDGLGDTKEKRVIDEEATRVVQKKAKEIKKAFKTWIFKDAERREAIVDRYNELFNSIRPREFDGSALSFPMMNSSIHLHDHQRNAIAHALFGGNTLFAHSVGAGKSATRS